MAATLACGPEAAISHRSAAALFRLLDRGPVLIDVIAPGQRGRTIDGIHLHYAQLPRRQVGAFDGIPCTSPSRTIVDLAGTVGKRTLRSVFERAAAKRMLDLDAIEASMQPARRGMPTLRTLLSQWRPVAPVVATQPLKSPLEAMVLPLLARWGLPNPRCNVPVELRKGRIEVDFLWPKQRFVVEADSRDFHATAVAFERDRWRDRELMRVGYISLRVTRQQAEEETAEIAATIASRLR